MRVRIAKERSDLTYLVSAAIKTTFHTRSPGGVERCIDVLNQLKSLSLSVEDLRLSESIFKLETLRRHRNPKIRKETQSLFHSWSKTLYSQGRDNSFIAGRLKPKKAGLTRSSELKKKEKRRYVTREAYEIKTKTDYVESMKRDDERYQTKREEKTCFLELNKKEYQRSLTHDTDKIKKETNTNILGSKKKEDQKYLTREVVVKIEKETKTDACKSVTTKQPCGAVKVAGNQKISSVTATALHQHPKRNIIDKDGKVTTKNLIPSPRRDAACKNIPRRPVSMTNQQQNGPAKDSGNPKSAALKTKTEEELKKKKDEMVKLFEAAKKAADVANSNGIFSGKPEASRCVEALSLLMKTNITPKHREPRRMMERLEGLTKHKYHKICNAASALLHLWRQRIREQERKESAIKTFSNKTRKLVM